MSPLCMIPGSVAQASGRIGASLPDGSHLYASHDRPMVSGCHARVASTVCSSDVPSVSPDSLMCVPYLTSGLGTPSLPISQRLTLVGRPWSASFVARENTIFGGKLMSTGKKALRAGATGLAISALMFGAATPAVAATNVIIDPALQACLNTEKFGKREVTTPITAAEVKTVKGALNCNSAPFHGVATLEGLQGADLTTLQFNHSPVPELDIAGSFPRLHTLMLQNVIVGSQDVLDLEPLAAAGDTLTTFGITNAVATRGAEVGALQSIVGFENFPLLHTVTVNASGVEALGGFENLTNLKDVRIGGNFLSNDEIAKAHTDSLTKYVVNINSGNDFSAFTSKNTVSAESQRYLSSEVLLKPADAVSVTAEPADRAIGFGGAPAIKADGSLDTGVLSLDEFIAPADLTGVFTRNAVAAPYEQYAVYAWSLGTVAPDYLSYTAYPVVTVDIVDANVGATENEFGSIAAPEFSYDRAGAPAFVPTAYSVTGGNLPDGLTLDPVTGAVSGVPSAHGDFTYTITAVDALGNAVSGDYSLSVEAAVSEPMTPLEPSTPVTPATPLEPSTPAAPADGVSGGDSLANTGASSTLAVALAAAALAALGGGALLVARRRATQH